MIARLWRFVVACLVALAANSPAEAQTGFTPQPLGQVVCQATAVPAQARVEGIANLVGDVLLTCTNVAFSSSVFTPYISINASVTVGGLPGFVEGSSFTNNVEFGLGELVSDAIVVINENHSEAPALNSTLGGLDARFPLPQYGVNVNPGRMEWNFIQFPVPGAPNDPVFPPAQCTSFDPGDPTGCHPPVTTVRFTNLRADISGADLSSGVPQLMAFVSLTGPTTIPVNNNVLNIGAPRQGLFSSVTPAAPGFACDTTSRQVAFHFTEAFPSAFQDVGEASFVASAAAGEAGYFAPGSGPFGSGVTQGTRLLARLRFVPDGVTVEAPDVVSSGSLTLRRVAGAGQAGAGGAVVASNGVGIVPRQGSDVVAVYEVVSHSSLSVEFATVALTVRWAAGGVSPGTLEAVGEFGPTSVVTTAAPGLPIPRFRPSNDSIAALTIEACGTVGCILRPTVPVDAVIDSAEAMLSGSVSASFPDCPWEVTGLPTWISVSGSPSRMGNGDVAFDIAANPTGLDRSASVSFAGGSFTVLQRATLQTFADVAPPAFFFNGANRLRARGVTDGCSATPLAFCPNAPITRGQVAVFLVRAVLGGDDFVYQSAPFFTDVSAQHPFFKWIQKLRELEITSGCGGGNFCPGAFVTRGQMAVFVIRARFGSTFDFDFPAVPMFVDAPANHPFYGWIQKLAKIGITQGCGAGVYCVDDPVTRGQMAIFVMRGAFNELLGVGAPILVSVSPSIRAPGESVTVTVEGANTGFQVGVTEVAAGEGITVGAVFVVDADTLTADLMIAPGAADGPRSLIATTNGEEAVLPNGFLVQTPE